MKIYIATIVFSFSIFSCSYTNKFKSTFSEEKTLGRNLDNTFKITKIEISDNYTILYCIFTNIVEPVYLDSSINIYKKADINIKKETVLVNPANNHTYKLLKWKGIPKAPMYIQISEGKKKYFKLYFEKIESGIEKINMTKCINHHYENCWNIKNIKIVNPKKN